MSQQINLLPPRKRNYTALVVAAVAVVAIGVGANALQKVFDQTARVRAEAAAAKQQTELMRANVARALGGQSADEIAARNRLHTEVVSLRARSAAERELLQKIEAGSIGRHGGYAEQLRALSAAAEDNVWVTRMGISQSGAVTLTGMATSNDAALQYARRLSDELRRNGAGLRSFEIHPAPNTPGAAPGVVSFTLS